MGPRGELGAPPYSLLPDPHPPCRAAVRTIEWASIGRVDERALGSRVVVPDRRGGRGEGSGDRAAGAGVGDPGGLIYLPEHLPPHRTRDRGPKDPPPREAPPLELRQLVLEGGDLPRHARVARARDDHQATVPGERVHELPRCPHAPAEPEEAVAREVGDPGSERAVDDVADNGRPGHRRGLDVGISCGRIDRVLSGASRPRTDFDLAGGAGDHGRAGDRSDPCRLQTSTVQRPAAAMGGGLIGKGIIRCSMVRSLQRKIRASARAYIADSRP